MTPPSATQSGVDDSQITALVADLEGASGDEAEALTQRIREMIGEETADLARELAPVSTGELVRSIDVEHLPEGSRVLATAAHAAFVEFGTWSHNVHNPKPGTYEIRPVRASALKFTGKDGRVVHAKVVHHPGVRPQPFINPAAQMVLDDHVDTLANAGVMLVVGT